MKNSFKEMWRAVFANQCLFDKWVIALVNDFFYSEVILTWVGTKLTDFAGCRVILIRRKPPVFKPNIWPPTSRMEWRGCSFFRVRKQWMLLGGGWEPEQGPTCVTDTVNKWCSLAFHVGFMRRGQGDLWGNYYLHLMFQLPELDGTKYGFVFLEWKLVVNLCFFKIHLKASWQAIQPCWATDIHQITKFSSRQKVKPL